MSALQDHTKHIWLSSHTKVSTCPACSARLSSSTLGRGKSPISFSCTHNSWGLVCPIVTEAFMGSVLLCVDSPDPPFFGWLNGADILVPRCSGLPKSTSERLSIYLQSVVLDWEPSVENWNPASWQGGLGISGLGLSGSKWWCWKSRSRLKVSRLRGCNTRSSSSNRGWQALSDRRMKEVGW